MTTAPGTREALSMSTGAGGHRLRAHAVTREVRGRILVDDVSLAVGPGELVAVIGASGAGKTTLLETLVGAQSPSAGRVTVDGVDVATDRDRADVGLVPQDDIIHRDLPLRETLRYAARLRLPGSAGRDEVDRTTDRVLAELDLTARADVPVRDLSGGQRKRASIAVELLTRPRVLALDEPTSGLDPATSAEVLRVLRRVAQGGTTVLLTTHAPRRRARTATGSSCSRRAAGWPTTARPPTRRARFGVHRPRRGLPGAVRRRRRTARPATARPDRCPGNGTLRTRTAPDLTRRGRLLRRRRPGRRGAASSRPWCTAAPG